MMYRQIIVLKHCENEQNSRNVHLSNFFFLKEEVREKINNGSFYCFQFASAIQSELMLIHSKIVKV